MALRLAWIAAAVLGGVLATLLWLASLVVDVRAHDHWINEQRLTDPVSGQWCCNLNDCQEESDNIAPVDGGYLVKSTGEVIERARVIWRSPGGWWRCRNLSTGTTRCLIGPPQGAWQRRMGATHLAHHTD